MPCILLWTLVVERKCSAICQEEKSSETIQKDKEIHLLLNQPFLSYFTCHHHMHNLGSITVEVKARMFFKKNKMLQTTR